ncbi:high affinity cAMP-specific and IBMX-insensitive 3',5'-cyclic phosphodiesterase 8A isoform X2 [Exaiptasia diaphana]|uniref:3',5'-cyclic-AMP phosphodiesterase n=1 Tax=Exaiptasia diaphana TaxID=2652724 RepID=A0A913XIL2_EXADI|nr:high affinity cAMP-specific and IBMX-insensitive 3',5'-cyclic phosphodiesterase 8A isoform X2 [Exaiptasia diaphana]XP_020904917.1 high affinity cAMP-specific and IBMX-insensitive 3',5'-cyclic phosphodiesterase 8A isoform X2 [Exaiptasia diaphana]
MGCAPSIHFSQQGIVFRDSSSPTAPRPIVSSPSEIVGHIRSSSDSGSHISTSSSSRYRGTGKYKRSYYSGRGSSIEAETQTQDLSNMSENLKSDKRPGIMLGPMKLFQPVMQVMLVFAKEDAQTESFVQASERASYKYSICKTSEAAMEVFLNNQPEVIFIDMRDSSTIDGEKLCKNIRATQPSDNSTIVAVVKPCARHTDEPSFLPLLKTGFDRRFVENTNVGACFNELKMLEYGEVRSQFKLRATTCLINAIEHTNDAVEITRLDPDKSDTQVHVEYVNPAFEKMTGYFRPEVIGHTQNLMYTSEGREYDAIYAELKKGKTWEGKCMGKRRNGEKYLQNVHIVPIIGRGGKVEHHVTVKREVKEPNSLHHQVNMNMNVNMHMETPSTGSGHREAIDAALPNGNLHRRPSMTSRIEAPITKVINMLNAAQENSPVTVVHALDRVVEILRSAELYSPVFAGHNTTDADDVMANDLVGGLMSNGRRRSGCEIQRPSHPLHPSKDRPHISHLPEIPPEALNAMIDVDDWDFDILKLEKASNHRPLFFLGMKILNKFCVCEKLNISEDVMKNWLQLIEANYHRKNAYHNSTHAADVLHATAVFLAKERVKAVLEPLDEVASLIAAIVHEVDHPGYTNSFLCNAGSELAILYNDIAVLESHHAALAFKFTAREEKSDIFLGLDVDDFRTVRQSIIDMVMATEMTRHFEHLSKFVNSINKRRSSSMDEVHSVHSGRGTPDSTTSSTTALTTPENRTLIKRMLIKCADIANPARPRYLCKEWAERIAEEYFSQTDEEKRRGLPVVMPVFDRATCNVPRSQVWFIDYFVSDLYDAWDAFALVPETIRHLTDNYDYWKKKADELVSRV